MKNALRKADSISLSISHCDHRLKLVYANRCVFDANGLDKSEALDLNNLKLVSVTVDNRSYTYDPGADQFTDNMDSDGWLNAFRKRCPDMTKYTPGRKSIGTNGVGAVEFALDGSVEIEFNNTSEMTKDCKVVLQLFNEYGRVITKMEKTRRLKPCETRKESMVGNRSAVYYVVGTSSK